MSATTADNPITTTLHRASDGTSLQDYEVRLTGGTSEHTPATTSTPAPPPNTDNAPQQDVPSNPPGWDREHRGVPPYRPANTQLDMSQRPWGNNPVVHAFVLTMFTGVVTTAFFNRVWRNTGGRINDRIFRYKIGGEI